MNVGTEQSKGRESFELRSVRSCTAKLVASHLKFLYQMAQNVTSEDYRYCICVLVFEDPLQLACHLSSNTAQTVMEANDEGLSRASAMQS